MESLEYIESYFKGNFLPDQKIKFEERIQTDEEFAEEVAFYLTAIQAARMQNAEDKKERFRELYFSKSSSRQGTPVRRMWTYAAAAAAILGALVVGVYLYTQPIDPPQLASKFINEHLKTVGVQMGGDVEALEKGKSLYNDGKYREAALLFEQLIRTDSSDYAAREFAGLSALQLRDYDKAVLYFSEMERNTNLHVNPGKFYHALALMHRNGPQDKEVAKALLTAVVTENLARKKDAQEFLKHF